MLRWIETIQEQTGVPEILIRLLFALLIFAIALVILRIGQHFIKHLGSQNPLLAQYNRARTLHSLFYSVFRVIVWFFAITTILGLFEINTASILTAAGIGGIAIALGAQNLVSDVVTGVLLLLDNSMNVGDYVALEGGIIGTVEDIQIRHIMIRGYTGMLSVVPNSEVKIISNYSRGTLQADAAVEVPYTISVSQAKEMVERLKKRAEKECPEGFVTLPYFIGIDGVSPLSYTVNIGSRTDLAHFWSSPRWMRETAMEELSAMGAYDHRSCERSLAAGEEGLHGEI